MQKPTPNGAEVEVEVVDPVPGVEIEPRGAIPEFEFKLTPAEKRELWDKVPRNTRIGYQRDFQRFMDWCQAQDRDPLPATPRTVIGYAKDMEARGLKLTSITRSIAAIGKFHKLSDLPTPTRYTAVRDVVAGIRRTAVQERRHLPKKAKPITADVLRRMVATYDPRETLRQKRNAAFFTLWFNCGFRRESMRNLRREDVLVDHNKDGEPALLVTLTSSKTDQEGQGHTVPVSLQPDERICAVRAVIAWLDATPDLGGEDPFFPRLSADNAIHSAAAAMSLRSIDMLVKRAAAESGYDATVYSTHSFRSGTATFLLDADVGVDKVAHRLDHKDIKTTRNYYRPQRLLETDPMRGRLGRKDREGEIGTLGNADDGSGESETARV